MIVAHPALPVIFRCSLPRKATAITFQRPCFGAHPLAAIRKQCYNIGNTRAGPLARLVRGMSIKGAFLSMQIVVKSPYPKGWLDYDGQVEKLKRRGLQIADEKEAKQFLAYSNYYRFTGYCLRFQHKDESGERVFNADVSFSDIIALYEIDKALRDCIADALGAVEISFRSAVAYHFAEAHGAFGHTVKDNFDRRFIMPRTDPTGRPAQSLYDEWHDGLISETKRSNELFVKHFEAKYLQFPDLPIWTALEICSFGTLSKMFKNMLKLDMKPIAARYSLQASTLDSCMHSFVYVRNICAHHSRLWDKMFAISPQLPPGKMWDVVRNANNKLYAVAMLLNWILAHDSFGQAIHSEWRTRFESVIDSLFEKFPGLMPYTGIPPDWKNQAIWASV